MELKARWQPVSFSCNMLSHIPAVPDAVKPKKDMWGKPIPRGTPNYERKREAFVRRRQQQIDKARIDDLRAAKRIPDDSVLRLCPQSRFVKENAGF